MLNQYFDAIFCINLDRRWDRLKRFEETAQKFNFTFQRWPAVDGLDLKHPNGQLMEENERRNNELACKLSHLQLLKYIRDNYFKSVLIFEDDARLTDNALDKISEVFKTGIYRDLVKGIPQEENWDMLYLGVNDINNTKEAINENLARIWTGFTTHAYIVNVHSIDRLIDALDYRGQADVLYADYVHPLGNSYAITPNTAYQEDGFSDITLKEESYQSLK